MRGLGGWVGLNLPDRGPASLHHSSSSTVLATQSIRFLVALLLLLLLLTYLCTPLMFVYSNLSIHPSDLQQTVDGLLCLYQFI